MFRIRLLPDANWNQSPRRPAEVRTTPTGPNVMRQLDRFRLPPYLSRCGRHFLSPPAMGL